MKHIDSLRISSRTGIIVCCVATLGKVVDVGIRYYTGLLVDNGVGQNQLMEALLGIILICGIHLLLKYLGQYTEDCFEASYTGAMFTKLENKVLYSEQEQIDKRSIGEFSTSISADVFSIYQYVKRTLLILIPDIISFSVCVWLIVNMKLRFGLVAIVSGVVSAFLMTKLSKSMVSNLNEYQNKLKKINGLTSDGLFNLEMVKVNQMEKGLEEQYAEELDQLQKLKRKVSLRQAVLSAPTMMLSFLTSISIAFCGGYFVLMRQMTIGQLLSAVVLSDYIVSPIMRFQNSLVTYRRATVNLKNFSLFEDMGLEKEIVKGVKKGVQCSIQNLSFHYPDNVNILDGVNLNFEKGKINYIIGSNGSGKSTLMKIIGGIYQIDGGEMNFPIKKNDRSSMRAAISIMPQESLIFADTVKANLLIGIVGAEEKMYEMCKKLGLHEEIKALEHGYDTILKEKGAPLSGGQKKRIAFIRSILHEATVYIFDEPTVNVDVDSSRIMMEYINELSKQHHVIMITHDKEFLEQYPGIVHDMKGGR